MTRKKDVVCALDMLTEGRAASVASALKDEAEAVCTAARGWTRGEGVQGLGVAYKTTKGKKTRQLSLKVYVEKKRPKSSCKKSELVPKTVSVGNLAAGKLPTDVVEIGKMELQMNTGRARPAQPGIGLGHGSVQVGTFGCLVRRRGSDRLHILSNAHVLADQGLAQLGDPILQPALGDGGQPGADELAQLSGWVPIQFTDSSFPNLVDAAIAQVRKRSVRTDILDIGLPAGTAWVRLGSEVKKSGRTSGFTMGQVLDTNFRVSFLYKNPWSSPPGQFARAGLQDQVLCTRYSDVGDSGSAVLNRDNRVVGLHFAGSSSASAFNKIHHVMNLLDLELVTRHL